MRISTLAIAFAAGLALGCGGGTPMQIIDMAMGLPPDGGGGTLMFGDICMVPGTPGDCAPGLICDMFAMNTVHRCTRLCDSTPTPTNCPAPSTGTCNAKNECKFTQ
jgi:hypothetical protein